MGSGNAAGGGCSHEALRHGWLWRRGGGGAGRVTVGVAMVGRRDNGAAGATGSQRGM